MNNNMKSEPILKVSSLSKSFFSKGSIIEVIDEINIEVSKGEFIGIFGPNGCGKSTFLNLIAGIETPSSGTINNLNQKEFADVKIGIVFQDYNNSLMPWKNCLENISFPFDREKKMDVSEKRNKVNDMLKLLGLEKRLPLYNYPYQMSGGEKQLTCIARALITNPDIILFDEPFASLDFQTRIEMNNIIEEIWLKTKKTIIFISHDIEEAIKLSDRLLLFSPRPARIEREYVIPFERPRTSRMETDNQFMELKNEIVTYFTKMTKI